MDIQQLKTGDILYTTCPKIPLCWHVGIVVWHKGEAFVYNNTPGAKNQVGGNVVCQPLEKFMVGRKYISKRRANICPNFLKKYSRDNAHRKWDALSYNCEDYVFDVWRGSPKSELRNLWQSVLAMVVLF